MDAKTRLDEMARGYQHSVVLLSACKLGVFAAMDSKPWSPQTLAEKLGVDERALETLMLALAAEGILIQDDGAFRLSSEYAPHLLPEGSDSMASILNHNHSCLKRWAQLDDVVQTGKPVPMDSRALSEDHMRDFILGMADISRHSSSEVAEKIDLSPYRRMLDLGGGPATSSIVFAQKYPQLTAVVFDLPGPIGIASEQIAKAGLQDRIQTQAGDYYQDELGSGFDLVYISNIIHSMPPRDVAMLFRKAHDALEPGGTILVKDFFLDESRTQPVSAALFSVNMLVGTEGGKSYTLEEAKNLLREAGFGAFTSVDVASASCVLMARKKA